MKSILYLTLIAGLSLRAQNTKIVEGALFDDNEGRWVSQFMEPGPDLFYGLSSKSSYNKDLVINGFKLGDGSEVFRTKVEFEKNENYIACHHQNKKILLFSSYKDEEAGKFNQVLRMYDDQTGAAIGKPTLLFARDYNKEPGAVTIEYKFSPDGQKMIAISERTIKRNSDMIVARVRLFNTNDLKQTGEYNTLTEYEGSDIAKFNFLVNNKGHLVYHFAYVDKKDRLVDAIAFYHNSNNPKILKLQTENHTLINRQLSFENGTLLFSGEMLCGPDQQKHKSILDSTRFVHMVIEQETPAISSMNFSLLSPDVLSKLNYKYKDPYYNEIGMKQNKMFRHYKTIFHKGNFYAVWLHHVGYSVVSQGVETINNRSREIIVIKYDKGGRAEWMRVIPRFAASHTSATAMWLNYATGNKLNFIFFENAKNLEKFPDVNNFNGEEYKYADPENAKSVPVCVGIDESGNLSREILAQKADFYFAGAFEDAFSRSASTLVAYPQTVPKKKSRFVLLKF